MRTDYQRCPTCDAGDVHYAALGGLQMRDSKLCQVHDRVDIGSHVPSPVLRGDVCQLEIKFPGSCMIPSLWLEVSWLLCCQPLEAHEL